MLWFGPNLIGFSAHQHPPIFYSKLKNASSLPPLSAESATFPSLQPLLSPAPSIPPIKHVSFAPSSLLLNLEYPFPYCSTDNCVDDISDFDVHLYSLPGGVSKASATLLLVSILPVTQKIILLLQLNENTRKCTWVKFKPKIDSI